MKKETFEFGLQIKMTPEEIMKELEGNVSGETQQLVQQFKRDELESHWRSTIHILMYDDGLPGSEEIAEAAKEQEQKLKEPGIPYHELYGCKPPSHQVLRAEDDYAIVSKYRWTASACMLCTYDHVIGLAQDYYLVGINDNNKYFIHELADIKVEDFKRDFGSLSIHHILDWVNKVDEGFEFEFGDLIAAKEEKCSSDIKDRIEKYKDKRGRLQGDILYQMIPIKPDFTNNSSLSAGDNNVVMDAKDNFPRMYIHLRVPTKKSGYNDYTTKTIKINTNPWSDDSKQFNSTTILGKHKLTVHNGMIYPIYIIGDGYENYGRSFMGNPEYYVVVGASLRLEHPEHTTINKRIPHEHVCLITSQRGRAQVTKFD